MAKLPKLPPKQDFMRYFQNHHALVKLAALVLIVLLEWGRAALYVSLPISVAVGLHRWFP
jgi:hypothetical protein